jgi:hypothetical protein
MVQRATDQSESRFPVLPWRNVLRTHQAAAVFPLLKDALPDAFDALVEDVRQYGVTETIKLVHDGSKYIVIDGRNRLDAMQELELDVWRNLAEGGKPDPNYFEILNDMLPSDKDVRTYVNSLNVHRRHMPMSAEQRRDWITRVLRQNPEASNRTIAEVTHAAQKTVNEVRAEMESAGAIPEVSATKGKDGKVRKVKGKVKANGASHTKVVEAPVPESAPAQKSAALQAKHWHEATDEQRCAFVRQVMPAAIVEAYGMPAFYCAMSEGQKQAIDDEISRMWEVAEASRTAAESAKDRQRNLARDIGAMS